MVLYGRTVKIYEIFRKHFYVVASTTSMHKTQG